MDKIEIKINIEDIKIFTQAAFILDQDDLFNKILEIRPLWNLQKSLAYEDFDEWRKELHFFPLTPEVDFYWQKAKEALPDLSGTDTENVISSEKVEEIINSEPIILETEHLLRKNGLSANYRDFILKAIVCGKVELNDWASTKIFKKFYHSDWWFNIAPFEKIYKGNLKKIETKMYREWYWANKKGITTFQISTDTVYRGKIDAYDFEGNVKKGIKRYKEFLMSRDI